MLATSPQAETARTARVSSDWPPEQAVGLKEIRAFLKRERGRIFAYVVLTLLGGILYLVFASPIYVANTKILLDQQAVTDQQTLVGAAVSLLPLGTSELESQMQVVLSERIARSVVKNLVLFKQHKAEGPDVSVAHQVLDALGFHFLQSAPASSVDTQAQLMQLLAKGLSARRIGESYVIEVSFSSHNPNEAVQVVNSITAAYILDKVNARRAFEEAQEEPLAQPLLTLEAQVKMASSSVASGKIDVDNFPAVGATVLTAASMPLGKSWPNSSLILAFSVTVGLCLGLFVGLASPKRVRGRIKSWQ